MLFLVYTVNNSQAPVCLENLLGMEKVQPQFVEAEEKVKGKSRMEERRRRQRRLKRKRAHSAVNGEQQRN